MSKTYHITQPGGTPHGPYDIATLKGMMARGEINSQTLCFTEGMSNWEPITTILPVATMPHVPAPAYPVQTAGSDKPRVAYILLGIFLGCFGVHNFFAGYTGKGIAQLLMSVLSCGILSFVVFIWNIIEICTVDKDAQGVPFS